MKKYLVSLFFWICSLCAFSQSVSNVQFSPEVSKVRITYTLNSTADISVDISTDGGKTFSGPLRHVTGDVGKSLSPGHKTIIWDALAEYDRLVSNNVCFRVNANGEKLASPIVSNYSTKEKQTFTVNGVSFTMIKVQGGTFTMGATSEQGSDAEGNENPAHQVTLSSYSIGETEVTQALWKAVMGNNPSHFKGDNLPVESVSWNECQEFTLALADLTGKRFRLPTEAEWEYAARGGNKSRGTKYSGAYSIKNCGWYDGNSGSKTHPVASKQPNELGLYDMSGSVYEWCSDWYGNYSNNAQSNPKGPSSGSCRVGRGGGWSCNARSCRVSNRFNYAPVYRFNGLGLRLVLSE